MKRSTFTALISGVTGVLLFGMGMCMCLLPQWTLFRQGTVIGSLGLLVLLLMIVVYRKMEHKPALRITPKTVSAVLLGIAGMLGLGTGMCFSMVFGQMVMGIAIGLVGIVLLFCLIPLCIGIK